GANRRIHHQDHGNAQVRGHRKRLLRVRSAHPRDDHSWRCPTPPSKAGRGLAQPGSRGGHHGEQRHRVPPAQLEAFGMMVREGVPRGVASAAAGWLPLRGAARAWEPEEPRLLAASCLAGALADVGRTDDRFIHLYGTGDPPLSVPVALWGTMTFGDVAAAYAA